MNDNATKFNTDIALFVGGPIDGDRMVMPAFPEHYSVPMTKQLPLFIAPPSDETKVSIMEANYVLLAIKGADGFYPIYVHDAIRMTDIVPLLIINYRMGVKERQDEVLQTKPN